MAKETVRTLDTLKASVDVLSLNNTVVSLRVPLKKTKIRVITKLVHQIRTYRKKIGSEEQTTANKRKCERLLKEIEEIKKLENDKVVKFALGNTKTLSEVSSQNDLETKAMIRLATHKLLASEVQKWRSLHSDWQSLAAFLMQHTSRRLRKKKRKVNEEAETSQTSKRGDGNHSVHIGESPTEELCSDDAGPSKKHSPNKKSGNQSATRDKKPVHQGTKVSSHLNPETDADGDRNTNLVQTSGHGNSAPSVCDEEETDGTQSDQLESPKITKDKCTDYICSGDVLVKRINLSELEHESQSPDEERDIQFLFRGKEEGDIQKRAFTTPLDEGSDDSTKGLKTKKRRDDFFLGGCSDTDETSSSENEMTTDLHDPLDDGEAAESKMSFAKKKMMVESTFLGCLSGGENKTRRKNRKRDLPQRNSISHHGQKPQTKQNPDNKNMKQMSAKSHKKDRSRSGDVRNVVQTLKEAKKTSKTAEKGLHPSWEASLRKKQEQSVSLTRFEGKKIKFDD